MDYTNLGKFPLVSDVSNYLKKLHDRNYKEHLCAYCDKKLMEGRNICNNCSYSTDSTSVEYYTERLKISINKNSDMLKTRKWFNFINVDYMGEANCLIFKKYFKQHNFPYELTCWPLQILRYKPVEEQNN